jgi:hypothetical protein
LSFIWAGFGGGISNVDLMGVPGPLESALGGGNMPDPYLRLLDVMVSVLPRKVGCGEADRIDMLSWLAN